MTATDALPIWSQLALHAYYYTTWPQRRRSNAVRVESGQVPVMILFYHRVAPDEANAWTISPRRFARQLGWLRDHFELVSLAEAQRRISSGHNSQPSVSITFDDGYADNCDFALPWLIREQIPTTYFVSSEFIRTGAPFPHDLAAGAPRRPNTVEQLQALATAGIEIGAHTRTHADLGQTRDPALLYAEVVGCRTELMAAVGCPIRYFAFPYGRHQHLNADAFQLAREAGYEGVCSAYGGYNFPGDDAFHLQRIHADREMIRLKNWLLVDPRKEARQTRFAYGQRPAVAAPVGGGLL